MHKLSNLLIIWFARPPVHGVAGAFRGSDRHCLGPHTICARPISQLLHKHLHRRCTPLRTASFALTIRRERTMVTPPVVIVTCAHLVPLLHLRYDSRVLLAAQTSWSPYETFLFRHVVNKAPLSSSRLIRLAEHAERRRHEPTAVSRRCRLRHVHRTHRWGHPLGNAHADH